MKRKFLVAEKRYILCDEGGYPITDKVFRDFKENEYFVAVQIGNKWGFVDENGELAIPAIYDDVKFVYNKAIAEANGICTIFDKDYKEIKILNENNEEITISEVIDYNFLYDFYFLCKTSDGKWGLYNLDFKPIVYPNYTDIIHNVTQSCLYRMWNQKGYIIFYSNEDHKICAYSFDDNKAYEYDMCDISSSWRHRWENKDIYTTNKYRFEVYKVYTLEDEGSAYLYYDKYIDSFTLVKDPIWCQEVEFIDLDMTLIFKKDEDLYNKDYDVYNIYVFDYEEEELKCKKLEFPFETNEVFVRNAYIPYANGRGGRHNDCPYIIIKDAKGPCYVVDTLNEFEVKAKLNKFWAAYFFMRFGKHFHKIEF